MKTTKSETQKILSKVGFHFLETEDVKQQLFYHDRHFTLSSKRSFHHKPPLFQSLEAFHMSMVKLVGRFATKFRNYHQGMTMFESLVFRH
jgi:hypothetical protein